MSSKRSDGGSDGPAVSEDKWELLKTPVVLAAEADKMEDPVIREARKYFRSKHFSCSINVLSHAVGSSLAQQMLGNSPIDRVAKEKMTKAKELRAQKGQKAAQAARTWTDTPYEDMKADVRDPSRVYESVGAHWSRSCSQALRAYLEHRTSASTRDVIISDYTLLKPGSTEKLLDSTTLKLVGGRRYGLAGRNGVGKSTLLREIATYRIPGFPQNIKVRLAPESIPYSPKAPPKLTRSFFFGVGATRGTRISRHRQHSIADSS